MNLSSLATALLMTVSISAFAQTAPAAPVQAVITGPSDIAVGRTLILDASASRVSGESTEYRWTIDETKQQVSRNVEAIYTPEKAGKLTFRLVIRSTGLDGVVTQDEVTHEVIAYNKKVTVIADNSVSADKLAQHASEALANGVLFKVIQPAQDTAPIALEDTLRRMMTEDENALSGADAIVIWTQGVSGLQALMQTVQESEERLAAIHNQSLIFITERSLDLVARTTRGAVTLLAPARVIITRKEAVNPLLTSPSMEEFLKTIESRDIDALTITDSSVSLRPWDFLSTVVNFLLANGVPAQAVFLILILPVIATIFTFLKQVIGITTFGLYTPSIVALSFLALGWWTALLFLVFILMIGYLTRSAMRRWRLLYIPKVALMLTVVSITLLLLVAIGSAMGVPFSRDTVFILLIMSTLAENFLNLKTEEGWWSAFVGISETVVGSLICVFIVQSQFLQSLVLAYPELILLTVIVNIFLGKWTGLRLMEYFRFRDVFKHMQEEE